MYFETLLKILSSYCAYFTDLAFAQASDVLDLPPATYSIAAEALLPGDDTATVIGPIDLSLEEAKRYTVFAVGKVMDDSLVS